MLRKLTPQDIGRLVVYHPAHKTVGEQGRITSFNNLFVFVDYDNTDRGQATKYEDLTFVSQEKTNTNESI